MIRFFAFALLLYLGYRGLKAMGVLPFGGGESGDLKTGSQADADLLKDPQCGVYFLKQTGVRAKVGNQTIYFCSRDCLDEYLKSRSSG